jgi:ABC-2 type transport system ATP-binding protein
MGAPAVLFLDEPTTGLDPRSRLGLWDVIADLKAAGTTIVLTTQYLEEADRLCDRISVIDVGRIIAEGTADELKSVVGGDVLEVAFPNREQLKDGVRVLARAIGLAEGDVTVDLELATLSVPVPQRTVSVMTALRALDAEGVEVDDVSVHRPSLDDVFLNLTGHTTDSARSEMPEPRVLFQGRRD